MLSSEWRRFVSPILRRHSSHTRSRSGQNHLPHSSRRFYSTVRRRVINANTAEPSKIYSSTDSQWMAKKRKELDKEFDETFFRKPKVLIIGSDPSAMTAALTLHSFNITPDILDTGHYMHPLAPTNTRAQIVPMNAMKIYEELGIRRQIEAIGTPINVYSRSDANGKALASLNLEGLRFFEDEPTLGVNYLELQRTLQSIVAEKMPIQPQCVVESIDSPQFPDTSLANVRWMRNFLSTKDIQTGSYDCVIISDGPFSLAREEVMPNLYNVSGVASLLEAVIPRPERITKGLYCDQWGLDGRVGFFPFGSPNADKLYVYAMLPMSKFAASTASKSGPNTPNSNAAAGEKDEPVPEQKSVPPTAMIEHFLNYGGPWRHIMDSISILPSVNHSPVLEGDFQQGTFPLRGRVLCLGDSGLLLPKHCLGHDLGISTQLAHYLGNALAIASAPIYAGLYGYLEQRSKMDQVVGSARTDIRLALHFNYRFPRWMNNWMLHWANSDKTLVGQQTEFLGLKRSKQEEEDAFSFQRVSRLREEWHHMDDRGRENAKKAAKAKALQLEEELEKQAAELRQQQAASPQQQQRPVQ